MLDNMIKVLQIIFYVVSIGWIAQQSNDSEKKNKKDLLTGVILSVLINALIRCLLTFNISATSVVLRTSLFMKSSTSWRPLK